MAGLLGQQLGNYQLTRLLGEGGFADVYLGEHIHLGTLAAIKVLHTQLTSDDVERFRTEARTIAHLIHPHIVRVLEFGVEGKTPFLVMDYAPNGTLRQHHPKGVALQLPLIVAYIKQVADALQYAHDQKLIHRDIKPENILLGRRNEILLSDFGIALVAQSSRYQSAQEMAGTMAYIAPEQIQGKPRPASDQYSLGIVVYEWLSGDRPFHGSLTELIGQHLSTPPPSLCEKIPTISVDIEQVVATALAKDPKQRYSSILAFANALEQASQIKQPESVPVVPVSETIDMNQSQLPTETVTHLPIIPLSHQTVSEVSEDLLAQPQTFTPVSAKEHLLQAEEERHQAERERARQETEQADKIEEKQVYKAQEVEVTQKAEPPLISSEELSTAKSSSDLESTGIPASPLSVHNSASSTVLTESDELANSTPSIQGASTSPHPSAMAKHSPSRGVLVDYLFPPNTSQRIKLLRNGLLIVGCGTCFFLYGLALIYLYLFLYNQLGLTIRSDAVTIALKSSASIPLMATHPIADRSSAWQLAWWTSNTCLSY